MSRETLPQAKLTTVSSFPANYFLENFSIARRQFGADYSNEPQRTVVCTAGRSYGNSEAYPSSHV